MTERTKCEIIVGCVGCNLDEEQKIDANKIIKKIEEMAKTHK